MMAKRRRLPRASSGTAAADAPPGLPQATVTVHGAPQPVPQEPEPQPKPAVAALDASAPEPALKGVPGASTKWDADFAAEVYAEELKHPTGRRDDPSRSASAMWPDAKFRRLPCKRMAHEGPAQCAEAAPSQPLRPSCGAAQPAASHVPAAADRIMADIRALGRFPRKRSEESPERALYHRLVRAKRGKLLSALALAELAALPGAPPPPGDEAAAATTG